MDSLSDRIRVKATGASADNVHYDFHTLTDSEAHHRDQSPHIPDPMMDHRLVHRLSSARLFDYLLNHFRLEVASRLTWIDYPDNPWRKIVLPLARHSICLHRSILSLAATHIAVTSGGKSPKMTAGLQVSRSFREATLRALNQEISRELNRDCAKAGTNPESLSLAGILATAILLCYEETLIPSATNWDFHLRACRTIIDRCNLHTWQKESHDPVFTFLIKEVVDFEAIGNVSSFARQNPATIESVPSAFERHFYTFTGPINEITAIERHRYRLLKDGHPRPDMDMGLWRTKLDQVYARISTISACFSLDDEARRKCFDAVIRAHYYASLIYLHQALAPGMESTQNMGSFITLLFHETQSLTAEATPLFSHDMFFPLFIAGTECSTDEHRQGLIEALFAKLIAATGFSCNYTALQFLRAFWTSPENQGVGKWIQYARENESRIGPFLIF